MAKLGRALAPAAAAEVCRNVRRVVVGMSQNSPAGDSSHNTYLLPPEVRSGERERASIDFAQKYPLPLAPTPSLYSFTLGAPVICNFLNLAVRTSALAAVAFNRGPAL